VVGGQPHVRLDQRVKVQDEPVRKPCTWCDADFTPQSRSQRFCSKSCAALHRNAVNPRPRKPAAHHWAKTPETQAVYGSAEYRRARDRLVDAAVGTPCPGCGRLLTTANCQADHVTPRSQAARARSATCVHSARPATTDAVHRWVARSPQPATPHGSGREADGACRSQTGTAAARTASQQHFYLQPVKRVT
jgi:hypothetical protein